MSTPGRSLATYEDLVRLPRDVRAELLAGEVITAPAPLPRHSKAQRALGSFIGRPYDDDDGHGGPGGWWIFVEVDVALGPHDVVRPDLSGWRRERLHAPGDRRPIEVAPDWVCEVLSPSTAAVDRGLKRDLYYRHEVGHYWLVDPLLRQVEVLARRPEGGLLLGTYGSEATVALPPFTDVTVPLGRLFLPPPDPDAST